MAYFLSNNYTKYYLNRTTTLKIMIGGWVVYFFAKQCMYVFTLYAILSSSMVARQIKSA